LLIFIAGIMIGAAFGIFIMCLMTAAGRADEQMEKYQGKSTKQ